MGEPNHDCNIMVFRPTMEEFKDFSRYISYMESQGAHRGGIAKVIPPKEWVPRKSYDNLDNFVIPSPISQVVTGQKGLFTQYNIQKKDMTVKDFRRLTNTPRFEPPFHESYEELERMYWKNITFNPPIYGADISGSIYDEGVDVWNIARLNTLLDVIELDSGVRIEGVNTAYLYFGMWKTTFAWHTEDMDLYSINYVHFGAPKSWYAVPPEHGKRLERLAAGFFPNSKTNCSAFLRHKMTMISPSILKQYGIPVNKITQEAGEFIITFPYGFHAGFNHGYNCAESTNFASERWVDYGKIAERCLCRNDMVTIDMDVFVQVFQPEKYAEWKSKKHETKLAYNEIPVAPDLAKPFPSWRLKVDRYRKIHGSLVFHEKRSVPQNKSAHKSKESSSSSSTKSPQKHKTKSPKQEDRKSVAPGSTRTPSGATSTAIKLEPPNLKDVRVLFSNAKPCASGSPDDIDYDVTASLEHKSLFDRVKSGSRRMSSARAINSIEEMHADPGAKRALLENQTSGDDCLELSSRKCKRIKSENVASDLGHASCSVQCEPLSSLPLEVVDQKTYVIKNAAKLSKKEFVSPPAKRRHPVSKKGISKKSSSKVLLKKESTNESDLGSIHGTISTADATDTTSTIVAPLPDSKASFKEERDYNRSIAKFPPHCAVCSLFKPFCDTPQESTTTVRGLPSFSQSETISDDNTEAENLTRPLIPEVSFASSVNHPSPFATCKLLDAEGRSPLIQCCVCFLQVHASCYGVEKIPKKSPWTCSRCMKRAWDVQCTLCCIRGGALKPISGKLGWAHIVCAVAIPEVYFDDTTQRNNINVSKIPLSRLKLQCVYCKGNKLHETSGVCLQCCAGRCTVSFHTTCAHAAGIPIEPGNWPFPIYVHCHKHAMMKIEGVESEGRLAVSVGDEVVAKNRHGKYCTGVVDETKNENFYKVNFKDNSWSDNLYQQDIVSQNWEQGGSPEIGSTVQVKWTDGDVYEAEYRGHSVQQIIKVRFSDNSVREIERSQVYTETEDIPQKIRKRMAKTSKASAAALQPTSASITVK